MSTKAKSDKDDSAQLSGQENSKPLSAAERQSLIDDIVRKMGDENTPSEDIAGLAANLAKYRKEAKDAKEKVSAEVHNLVQQIVDLRRNNKIFFANFQNEMVDGEIPFPKADVLAYCQAQGWMPSAGPRAAKASSSERASPKRDKSTPLFVDGIKSPSGKGAASNLPLDKAKTKDFGQYSSAAFKAIYEANKDNFEDVLKSHLSDEGKRFFSEEDKDQSIWKAWVEHIKTKPLPPKKK